MVTTTRRPNVDTFARWDAALKRANDKGLRLFQHGATGQWFCSGSDGQTVYGVGHFTCECAAALANDPVCQHRALYREACRVDDKEADAILSGPEMDDEPAGMSDTELDALIASATIPYDAALIGRMLDGEALTFNEAAAMEGTMVLSVAAGSRMVEILPARTMCTDCLDTGTARVYTGGRGNQWVPVTCSCWRRAA